MSRGMDPGDLRELVTIQELPAPTRDAGGGVSNAGSGDWSALSSNPTAWANLRPMSGHKRRLADQAGAAVTHELTIRYRTDVDESNRFVLGARVFSIVGAGVNLDGRDEFLRFEVAEGTVGSGP